MKLKRVDFNMIWGSCLARTLRRGAENPVWLAGFWPDEEARQVSRSVLQNLKAFRSMHKMKKVRSWTSGFPPGQRVQSDRSRIIQTGTVERYRKSGDADIKFAPAWKR